MNRYYLGIINPKMRSLLRISNQTNRNLALALFAATILSLLSLREPVHFTPPTSLSIPILMYHHVGDWGESRADADLVVGRPLQYRMPRIRVGYDDGIQVFADAMMLSQSQINAQKPKQ